MRVEESVDIAVPPERVWDLVADPENDPRWCDKVQSVEAIAPGRWRVMHKPLPFRPPVELLVEHDVLEPPRRLTMREEDDGSTFVVEYRLAATAAGTRFTQTSEFEWKRMPRLLQRVLAPGVRRDVQRQLRAVKRLLEAGRAPA